MCYDIASEKYRTDLHLVSQQGACMDHTEQIELPQVKKAGLHRRLYNWTLHWAHTPYGSVALFALAFCESSFFPIPPDVLLMALAFSLPKKSFKYAANLLGRFCFRRLFRLLYRIPILRAYRTAHPESLWGYR